MASGKTQRPRTSDNARREALISAATELFGEQGYTKTPVRDIADRLGILSGSVFHHFRTKEDLLREISLPIFAQIVSETHRIVDSQLGPSETVTALLAAHFELAFKHPHAVQILTNDWDVLLETFDEVAAGYAEVHKAWTDTLLDGIAQGVFRADMDVSTCYRIIRAITAEFTSVRRPNDNEQLHSALETLTTFVLAALAPPHAGQTSLRPVPSQATEVFTEVEARTARPTTPGEAREALDRDSSRVPQEFVTTQSSHFMWVTSGHELNTGYLKTTTSKPCPHCSGIE